MRDSLTGLYNHSAFYTLLSSLLEQQKNAPARLYLAVLDIDDFKKVNDTWGHEQGNKVLQSLAELLKGTRPANSFAARYGGEEFTCTLQGVSPEEAFSVMDNIRARFADLKFPETGSSRITLSCGLTEYRQGMSANDFFKKADKAMYAAKQAGKNSIVFPEFFPGKTADF